MWNTKEELAKRGLTNEQYIDLLNECAKKVAHESEKDWIEISDDYNLGWTGDCLRKACQVPLVGSVFVKEFFEQNSNEQIESPSVDSRIRELEQLKVKYRDERSAWQKQNREYARLEATLDLLSESLSEVGRDRYIRPSFSYSFSGEQELIVLLSDLHIGKCFDNQFGRYNSDIAQDRLEEYALKIRKIIECNPVRKINVVSLGDQINGNIHTTIAITNRENVIEQIKKASNLIADFCYEMCCLAPEVALYSVNGNHSRITKNKDDELRDERLDNLISWIVGNKLDHIDNFSYCEDAALENGIVLFKAAERDYVAVHGDLDRSNSDSVSSLCFMTKAFPEAILRGHFHSPSSSFVNGVQVIQSGSLDGSGDDYTLSKRLSGKPGQTCLLVNQEGIEAIYNIKFK